MSVKLELYQAVKAELVAIPTLKNVLHYNGQDIDNYEKQVSKRFPQAWIQLTSIPWDPQQQQPDNQNRTQQQKSGDIVITIYSAVFSLNEDDDTFETDLTLIDDIYRAVIGLEGLNFGPLQRVSENDTATNTNVRVWAQEYSTMLTEPAIAVGDVDAAPVTLVINKEIIT